MNIIVCIKQVPGTTKVDIDEKTGVLKRDGADSKMNPYDLFAIETALRLREANGGKISSLTMGPAQSADIIREAYALGGDAGYVLSDRAFAGSDVLATSYALSEAIKLVGCFDIIICGKQTTDGDTAQVGPEMAEFLNIPHAANVTEIHEVNDDFIRVTMDMGDYAEVCDILFPCLITVEKDIYVPRLPSYKKKIAAESREIKIITLEDLEDTNRASYGLSGSPTQVERIFPPEANAEKLVLEGDSLSLAASLFEKLKELKFV